MTDLARSKAFHEKALAPLGITALFEVTAAETGGEAHCGFGRDRPEFWIGTGRQLRGVLQVAFTAPSRAVVDAFHTAALEAGGTDNGKPGVRPHYHPNYYGAFVLDPDGHNIEVGCHLPG